LSHNAVNARDATTLAQCFAPTHRFLLNCMRYRVFIGKIKFHILNYAYSVQRNEWSKASRGGVREAD